MTHDKKLKTANDGSVIIPFGFDEDKEQKKVVKNIYKFDPDLQKQQKVSKKI